MALRNDKTIETADLTMECLLCGHKAELRAEALKGYMEPDTFEIYHCRSCNTSFSFPQVSDSEIYNHIYRNSSKLPGYWRYELFADKVRLENNPLKYLSNEEEAYWGVKKVLEKIVLDKTQCKILDVGCGLGYLTYSLRKDNYHAIGVDISEKAIAEAKNRFGDYYRKMDVFEEPFAESETFDVIILTEVIEHTDKPIDFVSQLLKYLNDNGKIIVTTPNKSVDYSECVWNTDLPPIHQWWFTKKSLRFMAQSLHVDVRFVGFSGFYFKNFQSLKKSTAAYDKNSIVSHLDKEGNPIVTAKTSQQTSIVRGVLSKIVLLKFVYSIFNRLRNWALYVRSGEGRIICAIFEKNKEQ